MRLTNEQIAEYRESGVLIVRRLLTEADLAPVIDDISDLIDARARKLAEKGMISQLHEDKPFEHRYAHLFEQCPDISGNLDIYQARLPAIFQFLRNDRLLDALESLIGPEITCNPIQHLRAKGPHRLSESSQSFLNVPWHQDSGVTWEEADPTEIITVWIPLANATVKNGCMQVIPGITNLGHLEHVPSDAGTTIRTDLVPEVPPRTMAVERGSVVFMSKYTPHRSTPNQTEWNVRWSLDLRYQPTGKPTGRPFYPAFVVRSRRAPDSVQTDHAEWCRRWTEALEAQARNPQRAHRVVKSHGS